MKFIRIFLLILIIVGIILLITQKTWVPKLVEKIITWENSSQEKINDYRNVTYVIEGNPVTKYFGNDFKTDLNNDGREDVVFYITQSPGGSGTFYYVVAAINTENGYVGSDAYFLGDRISPQNINLSPNPNHKNVIVVNYADRLPDEPFSTQPSVGKSVYLKLDENMRWAIVEPDFEGEAR